MRSRIHLIKTFLEQKKSPFAISRLIMMSGVSLRDTGPDSHDDPDSLAKVEASAMEMLTHDEQTELENYLERNWRDRR